MRNENSKATKQPGQLKELFCFILLYEKNQIECKRDRRIVGSKVFLSGSVLQTLARSDKDLRSVSFIYTSHKVSTYHCIPLIGNTYGVTHTLYRYSGFPKYLQQSHNLP